MATSQSQPAGSGCAGSNSSSTYDDQGNLTSLVDFNGFKTCFANDSVRGLAITSVEGLSSGTDCATVLPGNATLPALARKASTEYHPDYRLQTRVAVPGSITTTVYQGQPDPFNANAITSCVQGNPLLPNGKHLALVCKTVTQATTDQNGSSGFAAALDTQVPAVVETFAYNENGKLLTKTGVSGDAATMEYYQDVSSSFVGDPDYSNVVMLYRGDVAKDQFGDDVLVDYSSYKYTGNYAWGPSARAKFGGTSIGGFQAYGQSFNSEESTRFHPDSAYTVEMHVSLDGIAGTQALASLVGPSYAVYYSLKLVDGVVRFTQQGTDVALDLSGSSPISPIDWHHIAAVRYPEASQWKWKIFVDGVEQAQGSEFGNPQPAQVKPVQFGALYWYSYYGSFLNGYLDDIRVTRSARYTENFIPPTSQFAAGTVADEKSATGNWMGALKSVANAAGQKTQITKYDLTGRPTEFINPKGIVTSMTYTPSGKVASTTVTAPGMAPRVTNYAYNNSAELSSVTAPDGTTTSYFYDAAHRLIKVTDSRGNSINYTLDALGNKIAEQVKDSQGVLRGAVTRTFDALNRVQSIAATPMQ